jgi:hypothetical protein
MGEAPGTEVILADRKHTDEMVGEALREAGTLVIVFAPLYELFEPHRVPSILLSVLFIGVLSLVLGIEVERRRLG